jgi:hypothetical protein
MVVAAGVCCLVALAGACGEGGSKQEFSVEDQTRAEAINVTPLDLPAGWVAAPVTAGAGEAAGDAVRAAFDDCLAQEREALAPTADSGSGTFQSSGLKVASNVTFARSERAARAYLGALESDRGAFCLKQAIESATRELPPVPTSADQTTTTLFLSDVTVERLLLATPVGDEAVGLRASSSLRTRSGEPLPVTSDLVVFRTGRSIVTATFVAMRSQFPADLEQTVLSRLAQRAG